MAAVSPRSRAEAPPPEVEATRDLYERYSPQIYAYCLNRLGSTQEAEDAVQGTFLNAFRGLRRGVVPRHEAAWLFRIAQNVCLTRRRSARRRRRVESPVDFDLVEELASAPPLAAEELLGVRDALELLPANQRRAILLREWQGLSYREIADELGVTQSAVETLIFRARRGLAKWLERPLERGRTRAGRIRAGADLGGLVTALKTMLFGGAAAKVAGAAAVVAVSTVAVTVSDHGPRPHRHPTTAAPVRHAAASRERPSRAARSAGAAAAAVRTPARAIPVRHPARGTHAVRRSHAGRHGWRGNHRPHRSPPAAGRLVEHNPGRKVGLLRHEGRRVGPRRQPEHGLRAHGTSKSTRQVGNGVHARHASNAQHGARSDRGDSQRHAGVHGRQGFGQSGRERQDSEKTDQARG